jgi:hypothetical protein
MHIIFVSLCKFVEQDDDDDELLSIEADFQQDVIAAMRNPIHGGDS